MADTPISLLDRLRSQPDADAWQRLMDLYLPLLQCWVRGQGVADADGEDLVQEVLTVLVRELPRFQHSGQAGAFRCWLRRITVNRLRAFWQSRQARPMATGDSDFVKRLEQLEDDHSELSQLWDREHDCHVLERLLNYVQPEFQPPTWLAFTRQVLDGLKPAEAAAELGLSVNAVLIAKSRVLQRLRQEGKGLIE
jgi:RNA polymerase sigma-70 factor (ECF subfamily)